MAQQKKYALVSVYDKTHISTFANVLVKLGYDIISTGGTAKALQKAKIPFTPIQDITGNPESFDGRMKTISFEIESGILYDRTNNKHLKEAKALKIKPIDIVVCNLYPFEETINKSKVTINDAVENIDVGGPTMVRSAAKNFKNVLVIVDPKDYDVVSGALEKKIVDEAMRRELAAKAFGHLSFYDAQIAKYLRFESFPDEFVLAGRKITDLRYGENPHQKAAVYVRPDAKTPFNNLQKLWGRDLSLINITDINAGIESVRVFKEASSAVIKHNSPSGLGLGKDAAESLSRAIEADPESAFGGIIVLNKPMDLKTAKVIGAFKDAKRGNMDIVAAPSIAKNALAFLQKVRKTMGIYTFGDIPSEADPLNIKWIDGGFIIQESDLGTDKTVKDWKIVTNKKPTKNQLQQMQIGWNFITRIKSNTVIILDKTFPMTRGIGSGQTSRVRSTKIALEQAGSHTKGGILVSDSFFPFADSIELAVKHGITAVIQQGGSINDQKSIDAADKAGIPMIFTGRRAFWH